MSSVNTVKEGTAEAAWAYLTRGTSTDKTDCLLSPASEKSEKRTFFVFGF